jgi:uncharacterized membrane protein YphA (DoxX/SURF4 family)
MTTPAGWSVARRIGFRLGILAGALVVFPFPLGAIPNTSELAIRFARPSEWGVSWLAQHVLGITDPSTAFTGSRDRVFDYVQLLLIAIVAVLGTILWSIIDRRRRSYPRLAAAAIVVLRYVLAHAMLHYGISKILKLQFPDLPPGRFDEPVGELSPMRLMWTFMGYSTPYTMFAGFAEAIGGALLLWRRTATIGAVVLIPVMTNVVLLNFCYDVPVKLYSTELLIMAIAVASPSAPRLLAAALGRPVADARPGAPRSRLGAWASRLAALAMTAAIAAGLYDEFRIRPDHSAHVHELYGLWAVDSFIADGVEHPPLATDADRWRLCSFAGRRVAVATMAGRGQGFPIEVDARAQTITLAVDQARTQNETWSYTRPGPDRLVIDAVHGGRYLHVTLHLEPEPQLLTRGFHWISEAPFNR